MTRAALALVALGMAATVSAQTSAPLEVSYSQFTLPNGLNVILHQDRSVPTVTVNVWYHVGSARERQGRTGFAHLFEHLMFMGSKHVPPGQFDQLLEGVGGNNNGSTTNDHTNYWIEVPTNALELALFLESDRMGYLLDSMTPETVDAQREVVKNERRERYENEPYGMASVVLGEMLYPEGHPYRWPTIGHMEDLDAATYDDVVGFFRAFYAPSNASLVVAGDIDLVEARRLVEKWFSDIPAGTDVEPAPIPAVALNEVRRQTITDRVQLPRLFIAWLTPTVYAPGDAALDVLSEVLSGGRNSRLYKRLVYDMQIAQSVSSVQYSGALSSFFLIDVMPQPGHTLDEVQAVVDEEIARMQSDGPTAYEVQRALNQIESSFYRSMESVGGFSGKADQLNGYFVATGNPDWFNEDLARFRSLSASDVQAAARAFLPASKRAELRVVPEGQ